MKKSNPSKTIVPQPVQTHSTGDYLGGLMTGAIIGAAAYYLFATEEGKVTKNKLINLSKKYIDEIEDLAEIVKDKSVDTVQKAQVVKQQVEAEIQIIKPQVEEKIEKVKQKAEEIKQVIKEEVEEKKQEFEKIQKQAGQTKKELKKELKILEHSVADARKKADEMQKNLENSAKKIEHKFFQRHGRSLGK